MTLGVGPMMGLLSVLSGLPAHAAPEPVLAPGGPMHLGPLGPDAGTSLLAGRDVVDVDIATGSIWLQCVDLTVPGRGPDLQVVRTWRDGAWHLNLDDRLRFDHGGVELTDTDGVTWLPLDEPAPTGLADDGSWAIGTTFGGGRIERTEQGYVLAGELRRTFDGDGLLVRLEDSRGNGLDYEYDTIGLARVVADDGRSLRVLHDSEGTVSAMAAPGGNEHFYAWVAGDLVASIGRDGRTRYSHDEQGRLRAVVWPDGSQIRASWDDDGRMEQIAGPGSTRRIYRWNARGLELTTERGATWRIDRDERLEIVRAPTGVESRRTWDDNGLLETWTAPDGTGVRLVRDDDGHVAEVIRTSGTRWRLGWEDGAVVELTDPAGGRWRLDRDEHGDLVGLRDPASRETRIERDPFGQVVAVQRGTVPWRLDRDVQGRIQAIQAPSGSVTRISRDTRGRVTKVADPSGSETLLSGYVDDRPKTIVSRGGGLWALSYDDLGRPTRVERPDGSSLALRRDREGRLESLWLDGQALLRLTYRSDGLLTRLEDAVGGTWGVVGDSAGNPIAIRDPRGVETPLTWDGAGRLASVGQDTITRDPHGNPTDFAGLKWTWDGLDRLLSTVGQGLEVVLSRDGSGAVRGVTVGDLAWTLVRDPSGFVREVVQGDEAVVLLRNNNGHLIGIGEADERVHWDRDDRGSIYRVRQGDSTWRYLVDAEGRTTRWTSPSGAALSVDRTPAGEPVLTRFPDGTLRLTERTPELEQMRIQMPTGEVLLERTLTRNEADQVIQVDERGETARSERLHRDASGQLVARESDDGAWLWSPGQISAPDGGRVVLDEDGHPLHATPPVGPLAWGIAEDVLSYDVDDAGCITQLIGDSGTVDIAYDALGRPIRIEGPDLRVVPIRWDPLGRPVEIGSTRLIWGTDGPIAASGELGRVELLHAAGAGLVLVGDRTVSVVPDDEGRPRVAVHEGEPQGLAYTPMGFATHDVHLPLGPHGAWQIEAGPLVDGGGLWDPVSGARACVPQRDRQLPLGWTPTLDASVDTWWGPDDLAPDDVWHDPLVLLAALGEVPDESRGWTTIQPEPSALPWLPASAGHDRPAILPPLGALPLDVDEPVGELILIRSLPPSQPFDEGALLRALTAPDLDGRPEVDWTLDAFPTWAAD